MGIAQLNFSRLTLIGGIAKIFLAQLIFKIGVLIVAILSGIESRKS
jgi:hypothetical protein